MPGRDLSALGLLYFFQSIRPDISSAVTRKILEYCQGSENLIATGMANFHLNRFSAQCDFISRDRSLEKPRLSWGEEDWGVGRGRREHYCHLVGGGLGCC